MDLTQLMGKLNEALFILNKECQLNGKLVQALCQAKPVLLKPLIKTEPEPIVVPSSPTIVAVAAKPKTNGKTKVKIKIVFQKIGAIDTMKDNFTADVIITTKWRAPNLDGKKNEVDKINWDEQWTPKITVTNIMGESKIAASFFVLYDNGGRAVASATRKFSGKFHENMELYDFPFDRQDMTICATSEHSNDEVELFEDQADPCGLNSKNFSAEQEWALSDTLRKWAKVTKKKVKGVVTKHPSYCISARASRRPQFFIFNVIIILVSLCCLCFSSFTVSQELVPNRLQMTFTIILTCVTFKFVVSKNLPKISYLTCMDKYILGSMIILIAVCFWHAISGSYIFNMYPKVSSKPTAVTTRAPSTTTNVALVITTVADYPTDHTDYYDYTDAGGGVALKNATKVPACTTAAPALTKPGPEAVLVDRYVMAAFMTVYLVFNLIFLVKVLLGYCESEDNGEETEIEED